MPQPIVAKLLDPPDRRSIGRSNEVVDDVLADDSLFGAVFAAMNDAEPVVQMRAADAVEKITRVRAELLHPYVDALLSTAAATEQKEVRWHAAQLLGACGFRRAFEIGRLTCCFAMSMTTAAS